MDGELVFLEDLAPRVTWRDKLAAAGMTFLVPVLVLERWLGLTRLKPDDVMTVIFTSGSTGVPKGVELTYANIGSNTQAIDQAFQLTRQDVIVGILPFFHSFGFTVTLWSVLALDKL